MSEIKFRALGWDGFLPENAARELLRSFASKDSFPADFSSLLIVLPTREAARILREHIAMLCAPGGALGVNIVLPEQLLRRDEGAPVPAVLAAWAETLCGIDDRDFPELFCNNALEKYRKSDEIILGWSELFQNCRLELAAEGITFDEVIGKLKSEGMIDEAIRFEELQNIEKYYLRNLKKYTSLPDPASVWFSALENPLLPEGVEKIILIDCCDMGGAAIAALEQAGAEIECWINAPESELEHFDRFGRVEPEYWRHYHIDLDLEEQVRCVPQVDQQARMILKKLIDAPALPGAVVIADPEVTAALENHAATTPGAPQLFVPRQLPLINQPWSRLLCAIINLYGDTSVAAAREVWANPLFADFARRRAKVADLAGALKDIDEIRELHLAKDISFFELLVSRSPAKTEGDLGKLCVLLRQWRQSLLEADSLIDGAWQILSQIGEENTLRNLDLRQSEDEIALLKRIIRSIPDNLNVDRSTVLLRRMLAKSAIDLHPAPGDGVDVVGFLEAPWRSEQTLLMAGFNEKYISAVEQGGPLLPEMLRERLGMMTARRRRAADALRFAALAATRRLFILYGRESQGGQDTLHPSRLLMQCRNDELPERVEKLFGSALLREEFLPEVKESQFAVEGGKVPLRMRITGFSAYLRDPLLFYLEHVLKLKNNTPDAVELDNLGYGTLLHSVLEELPAIAALTELELAAALKQILDKKIRYEYGKDAPGIVMLQRELMEESLEVFAAVQTDLYRSGWRLAQKGCEVLTLVNWGEFYSKIFPGHEKKEWRSNITLSGKIDRIELMRDNETGVILGLRVLDYKSSSKPMTGESLVCSLKNIPENEQEYRRIPGVDKAGWADLQLPLYMLMLCHGFVDIGEEIPEGTPVSAGYFNLPLELSGTGVVLIDMLNTSAVLESAAKCADWILERIYQQRDFAPAPDSKVELFEEIEMDGSIFQMKKGGA